jgi:hypothetical protein
MSGENGNHYRPPSKVHDPEAAKYAKLETERIARFRADLAASGLAIAESDPRRPRAHRFQPYPSPTRAGCVICPYPREHPVHAEVE